MLGLYIHIPFCNSLCKFCDFPKRIKQSDELKKQYINKLINDLEKLDKDLCFDTVYIGGGTPNSLSNDLLEALFQAIHKLTLNPNLEFSIEANFELITNAQAKLFKKYNINRISIGIQTFNKEIGKYINRESNYHLCQEKIHILKNNNILNINGDFIFGLPHQKLLDVKEDLNLIKSLPFKHISYYSLILEDKTVMNYELLKNKLSLPDEDLVADMYEFIQKELKHMGYQQYEISNFAFAGFESKHNSIYWQLDDYIGIGMSAASFYQNKRYTNSKIINENLQDLNIFNDEVSIGEYFWLGLRMTNGVSITKFKQKYQLDPFELYPVQELINKGLLKLDNDLLKLTELGLDHGNYVFECFI